MEYAAALVGGGSALDCPEWQCALVRRAIANALSDAAGPYPRAPLAVGPHDLAAGFERLRQASLVSVVLVADPFFSPGSEALSAAFAVCRPFKTHLTIDREKGPFDPTKHHRDRIRRGRRRCRVEVGRLGESIATWSELYAQLVERREITGAAAFTETYFASLAELPEMVAFTAFVEERAVGMTLWFQWAEIAYSHLTAINRAGYENGATYALNDAAIDHFADAKLIDLGGGAGHADDPEDGLFQFKAGFANSQATAMLCGEVLDPARYEALSSGKTTSFFPAYRG